MTAAEALDVVVVAALQHARMLELCDDRREVDEIDEAIDVLREVAA